MARGGHRWGAGRPGYKLRADFTRSVDIRRWQRDGLLDRGYFGWQWSDPDTQEVRSSIGVWASHERVRLVYRVGEHDIDDTVRLTSTPCNYGGRRYWFQCPHCFRRCASLFLRAGRFRCRTCQRISYRSQSEDVIGRAWLKQAKLEARLDPNWQRPKGMRHATRDKLLERIWRLEEIRDDALAAFIARLGIKW